MVRITHVLCSMVTWVGNKYIIGSYTFIIFRAGNLFLLTFGKECYLLSYLADMTPYRGGETADMN